MIPENCHDYTLFVCFYGSPPHGVLGFWGFGVRVRVGVGVRVRVGVGVRVRHPSDLRRRPSLGQG